jgi:hypothetical protein
LLRRPANAPWIFEPRNAEGTGAYSNLANGQVDGSFGYGVGKGGYGDMDLPDQVFMQVHRSASNGIAQVDGYGGYGADAIAIEYAGSATCLSDDTNQQIEQLITKPSRPASRSECSSSNQFLSHKTRTRWIAHLFMRAPCRKLSTL